MKLSLNTCILVIVALAHGFLALPSPHQEVESRVEPATVSLIASLLAPIIIKGLQGLVGSLFKPSDYQDAVIYGRSMRIKLCGDGCVQITDRPSGLTAVGRGNTTTQALGDASQKIFHDLLDKRILSLNDLCHLHVTFPHPNQEECPGVQINPCDLIIVIEVTKPPCKNKLGDRYCLANQERCHDHHHDYFMMENCYKTCTNNCTDKDEDDNKDPCGIPSALRSFEK